jgi:pilus assembly protein Flp/PilA
MVNRQFLLRILRDSRGATAIEYGLIVALIALGALAAFKGLGASSDGAWGSMSDEVTSAMS